MHRKFSKSFSQHSFMRPSLPRKAKQKTQCERILIDSNKTSKIKLNKKNIEENSTTENKMNQLQFSMDNIISVFPTFDGKKNYDITSFLHQYETLANEIKIPDSLKVIVLRSKITGQARDTILENDDLNAENDFDSFKDKLLEHFKKEHSFEKTQNSFMTLKQEPRQTIDDFVKKFNTMANKYLKTSGLSEQEGAKNFLETVKLPKFLEQIRQDIATDVRKQGPKTFHDAVKMAKNIEAALEVNSVEELNSMKTNNNNDGMCSAILALAKAQQDSLEKLQQQINTLKVTDKSEDMNTKPNKYCEICNIPGHTILECWYNAKVHKQNNRTNVTNPTDTGRQGGQNTFYPQYMPPQPYIPPFYMPMHMHQYEEPTQTQNWPSTANTHYYNQHGSHNSNNYAKNDTWDTQRRPQRQYNNSNTNRSQFKNTDKRGNSHNKFSEN